MNENAKYNFKRLVCKNLKCHKYLKNINVVLHGNHKSIRSLKDYVYESCAVGTTKDLEPTKEMKSVTISDVKISAREDGNEAFEVKSDLKKDLFKSKNKFLDNKTMVCARTKPISRRASNLYNWTINGKNFKYIKSGVRRKLSQSLKKKEENNKEHGGQRKNLNKKEGFEECKHLNFITKTEGDDKVLLIKYPERNKLESIHTLDVDFLGYEMNGMLGLDYNDLSKRLYKVGERNSEVNLKLNENRLGLESNGNVRIYDARELQCSRFEACTPYPKNLRMNLDDSIDMEVKTRNTTHVAPNGKEDLSMLNDIKRISKKIIVHTPHRNDFKESRSSSFDMSFLDEPVKRVKKHIFEMDNKENVKIFSDVGVASKKRVCTPNPANFMQDRNLILPLRSRDGSSDRYTDIPLEHNIPSSRTEVHTPHPKKYCTMEPRVKEQDFIDEVSLPFSIDESSEKSDKKYKEEKEKCFEDTLGNSYWNKPLGRSKTRDDRKDFIKTNDTTSKIVSMQNQFTASFKQNQAVESGETIDSDKTNVVDNSLTMTLSQGDEKLQGKVTANLTDLSDYSPQLLEESDVKDSPKSLSNEGKIEPLLKSKDNINLTNITSIEQTKPCNTSNENRFINETLFSSHYQLPRNNVESELSTLVLNKENLISKLNYGNLLGSLIMDKQCDTIKNDNFGILKNVESAPLFQNQFFLFSNEREAINQQFYGENFKINMSFGLKKVITETNSTNIFNEEFRLNDRVGFNVFRNHDECKLIPLDSNLRRITPMNLNSDLENEPCKNYLIRQASLNNQLNFESSETIKSRYERSQNQVGLDEHKDSQVTPTSSFDNVPSEIILSEEASFNNQVESSIVPDSSDELKNIPFNLNPLSIQTKSNSENYLNDQLWIPKLVNNKTVYVHSKSGMSSFTEPLISSGVRFVKRNPVVPKGLSPNQHYNIDCAPIFNIERDDNLFDSYENSRLNTTLFQYPKNYMHFQNPNISLSIVFNKENLETMRILGQIDRKFIAAMDSKNLLVIFDQHAISERILLEKILIQNRDGNNLCKLNLHYKLQINFKENIILALNKFSDYFDKIGFTFVCYYGTIIFESVPKFLGRYEKDLVEICKELVINLVNEFEDDLVNGRCFTLPYPKSVLKIISSQACRYAIKFGDKLELDECENLVKNLLMCHLPFQCAHGRPSIVPLCLIKDDDGKVIEKPDYSKFNN